MTDNYFNTKIVERHDDHMRLNNWLAEFYDFCSGVSYISEADRAWYTEQKRYCLCYDV